MGRIRIIVFSSYTKPYYSGSGINAWSLAKQLKICGNKVSILTYNWNYREKLLDSIDGVSVVRIPFFSSLLLIKFLGRAYLALMLPLFLLILRLKYKQLIVYGAFPGYILLIFFARLFAFKIIFRSTMLGSDDVLTLTAKSKIRRHIFSKIDYYYATTPTFKKKFIKALPNAKARVFLTTPGVDVNIYNPTTKSHKVNPDSPIALTFISIGNLVPRKGYEEIFKELSKLNFNFKYLVLGAERRVDHFNWHSDITMQSIKEKGIKLLGQKVEFIGWTDDVQSYLERSDILILNSKSEGLPNSLLEAMACGVVPVTRKIEGLSNYLLISKENSFEFSNPKEIVEILNELHMNSELLNMTSFNARRTVENSFSFSEAVKQIVNVLN
jgi:glycosyltransferase involved in cell wall biosynthesis